MVSSETTKVSWNASQGIITEISNRRTSANTFFINGDMRKALNTLISIKQSVIQSFKPEEREKLKKIEEKFDKVSKFLTHSASHSFNNDVRHAFSLANDYATDIYSKYNDLLMDLLEDRGYLVGQMADASKMRF
jgi:hypothetical protein